MTPNGIQRSTTRTFEFSVPLDTEKTYITAPISYKFKIGIPSATPTSAPSGIAGAVVQVVSALAMGNQSTKWYLEAKLDIPKGFDVSKKKYKSILYKFIYLVQINYFVVSIIFLSIMQKQLKLQELIIH